jgi:hypothetical protein
LGEVARRDPRWLAELALERMGARSLAARIGAAYVFRGLTARSFGFDPEAFEAERAAPLRAARAWWAEHKAETREQWLVSHFRERGFALESLRDKSALPVLVEALHADAFTHGLAIEQISALTGKYFGSYAQPALMYGGGSVGIGGGGYETMSQERATIRVTGWLEARGLFPAAAR